MIGQYLPQTNETCYSTLQWLMWLFASTFYNTLDNEAQKQYCSSNWDAALCFLQPQALIVLWLCVSDAEVLLSWNIGHRLRWASTDFVRRLGKSSLSLRAAAADRDSGVCIRAMHLGWGFLTSRQRKFYTERMFRMKEKKKVKVSIAQHRQLECTSGAWLEIKVIWIIYSW